VETHGLTKRFPGPGRGAPSVTAVDGIDLAVATGEVFGLLGPNGAGKTTTMRMLTTLLPVDDGEARVAGFDVTSQQGRVRRAIGYVGQLGGADGDATGRENLTLAARMYGLSRKEAAARGTELAGVFDLGGFLDRPAKTYSGGQRRRLELALGLVSHPQVLFLDEPTTGLDPQNRANLWEHVRSLRTEGTTVVLTTHYMDEADQLADEVCVIDHGRIIASGPPDLLKRDHRAASLDQVFLGLTGRTLRDTGAVIL
jgi:ABC-2 type transport system ATP-binding protein